MWREFCKKQKTTKKKHKFENLVDGAQTDISFRLQTCSPSEHWPTNERLDWCLGPYMPSRIGWQTQTVQRLARTENNQRLFPHHGRPIQIRFDPTLTNFVRDATWSKCVDLAWWSGPCVKGLLIRWLMGWWHIVLRSRLAGRGFLGDSSSTPFCTRCCWPLVATMVSTNKVLRIRH